jgi:asparagine synthase (glutamine-hydrolysing)
MDRSTVVGLIGAHLEGRQNRRLLIWSLLNFENWLQRYC